MTKLPGSIVETVVDPVAQYHAAAHTRPKCQGDRVSYTACRTHTSFGQCGTSRVVFEVYGQSGPFRQRFPDRGVGPEGQIARIQDDPLMIVGCPGRSDSDAPQTCEDGTKRRCQPYHLVGHVVQNLPGGTVCPGPDRITREQADFCIHNAGRTLGAAQIHADVPFHAGFLLED